jgi:hypothetical protein
MSSNEVRGNTPRLTVAGITISYPVWWQAYNKELVRSAGQLDLVPSPSRPGVEARLALFVEGPRALSQIPGLNA